MKVKMLVFEDESEVYIDAYIDESKIIGYYWTIENMDDESMNILFSNTILTIKRNKEVVKHLTNKNWH